MCNSCHMIDNIILRKIVFFPRISHHVQFVYLKIFRIVFFCIVNKGLTYIRSCACNKNFFFQAFINFHRLSKSNITNEFFFCFPFCIVAINFCHCSRTAFYYSIVMSYFCHCSKQAFQIKCRGTVLNPISVQFTFLFYGDRISSIDLRPSSNSGLVLIYTIFISLSCKYILIPQSRSGTHQRQRSIQHVKQLGKFIQRMRT